jgi:hypothetical protein
LLGAGIMDAVRDEVKHIRPTWEALHHLLEPWS